LRGVTGRFREKEKGGEREEGGNVTKRRKDGSFRLSNEVKGREFSTERRREKKGGREQQWSKKKKDQSKGKEKHRERKR